MKNLTVKDAIIYLSGLGIEIQEPALRTAIRKEEIKDTFLTSKKEGIEIPITSLHEFALKRTNNTLIAYEIGRRQMKEEYNRVLNSVINSFNSN